MRFESDPYCRSIETDVVSVATDEHGRYAVLSDTIFYPEGGGQPADRGVLSGVAVIDVQKVDGAIRHYLEAEIEPGPGRGELDWARRFDHMQHHTGQHLLSALAEDRFGWRTTAFHLGAEVSAIEIDTPSIEEAPLRELEEALATVIREAREIRVSMVNLAEFDRLEVRTRGLPRGHKGDVRLVEIDGVDLNTCGGTHLRKTSEIEVLCLVGTERMRGGTRLSFLCGRRARQRFNRDEVILRSLRERLDCRDDDLADKVDLRYDEAKRGLKREKRLEGELARRIAHALAGSGDSVATAHLEDAAPGFLQKIAKQFIELDPGRPVLLTSGSGESGPFVVAAGVESPVTAADAGRSVVDSIDGKGGGRGSVFQGSARALSRRREALDALSALVIGFGSS